MQEFLWATRTQVSALLANGHPYDVVMGYPLATIWAEYEAISLREGGRIASESLLMKTMLSAWFSGKDEYYKKKIIEVQHGG